MGTARLHLLDRCIRHASLSGTHVGWNAAVILVGMTHKVGPKGQVVIPKALREELGLRPGDEVSFSKEEGGVLVEPVRDDEPLRGRFRDLPLTRMLEEEHRRELEAGK